MALVLVSGQHVALGVTELSRRPRSSLRNWKGCFGKNRQDKFRGEWIKLIDDPLINLTKL